MLLIWGWRTRFKVLSEGAFHCPSCGGDRHYAHKQARRWFTLFFIPLIPLKVLGELVECQTCSQGYDQRILALPTSAALGEQLTAATREAAVQLLRIDDSPSARMAAVLALSHVSDTAWTEATVDADVRHLDVAQLSSRLRQLGEVMNEHGKERFLASVTAIASGGGVLGDGSRQALAALAADLGMTPAHARGVIDQAMTPPAAEHSAARTLVHLVIEDDAGSIASKGYTRTVNTPATTAGSASANARASSGDAARYTMAAKQVSSVTSVRPANSTVPSEWAATSRSQCAPAAWVSASVRPSVSIANLIGWSV
jgi:hypothetical protein